MEATPQIKSSVRKTLDRQRDESDARAIINEVERINTLEEVHRFRWIWELVQNARDEAGEGVDIICELTENFFSFSHNGQPFLNEHLLALLRKTSTKPIDGAKGNTGKFGTGFVTSHLLNKIVTITGIHQNEFGDRKFEFVLDRHATTLTDMQQAISQGIENIEHIDGLPASEVLARVHSFRYELTKGSYEIAEGGIKQLETNLPFAMLVNGKIRTLNIKDPTGERLYHAKVEDNKVGNLSFIRLEDKNGTSDPGGLLFLKIGQMIIAVPAIDKGHISLLRINQQARLFKDLPLIGTETLYIPVILQHNSFLPTEPRDGVRTRVSLDVDEDEDIHALTNRRAFKEFVEVFPKFLEEIVKGEVRNQHLLAESGLPTNVEAYYGKEWYTEHVQQPIREAIKSHDFVRTISGNSIPIEKAVFIKCESEYQHDFYNLVSKWFPEQCPNEESYEDWVRIISQESGNWPEGIIIDINKLVSDVADKVKISEFNMDEATAIAWLQELITYLEMTKQASIGHDSAIYPNQDGKLVLQNNVFHDIGIDSRFKQISNGMGRRLEEKLLPKQFEAKFVEDFDEKEFLIDLNTNIGKISIHEATQEEIQAVVAICCSFRKTKAERRDQWFELLNELLPEMASEKVIVEVNEDYQFEPAEKCSLKYVCSLIEKSESVELFAEKYFETSSEKALQWLNRLYDFVFRNEENKAAALVYKIVPTQDGFFKKYTEEIFRENDNQFDDIIKDLYKQYTDCGDPREFLVNTAIKSTYIRTTPLQKLTKVIDEIFNDRDSEDKVKEGLKYHDLFLKLKEWTDKREATAKDYFSIFCSKRPVLYIKAFGGEKFSRLLKLNKSVEEIEQLDMLKLSADELKKLDDAVAKLGNSEQLLDKAKEMIDYAELIRWRQAVGDAAEQAFLDAIGEAESKFLNPDNPDNGKDFVIKLNGKEYSIELKSAVEGKETVKMSIRQGEFAVKEKDHYALCVISRPSGQLTRKEQFIAKARFVTNIGELIGDKVENWRSGLQKLDMDGDIRVELDSRTGSVNIRKGVWKDNKNFHQFVNYLKDYFEIEK